MKRQGRALRGLLKGDGFRRGGKKHRSEPEGRRDFAVIRDRVRNLHIWVTASSSSVSYAANSSRCSLARQLRNPPELKFEKNVEDCQLLDI
jgi:hypothetical protein